MSVHLNRWSESSTSPTSATAMVTNEDTHQVVLRAEGGSVSVPWPYLNEGQMLADGIVTKVNRNLSGERYARRMLFKIERSPCAHKDLHDIEFDPELDEPNPRLSRIASVPAVRRFADRPKIFWVQNRGRYGRDSDGGA